MYGMQPGYTPSPGYGQLLPAATPLHPSSFSTWFFLFWAGALVVLIAIPWALVALKRHRNWLPLLALGSGFITSLGEPMLDHVGHLRWADNLQGPAFSNFGLDIPLLIPPCYALFMGLEAYWIFTIIQRGITVRQFFLMFAAVGVSDAIMEHPGVILHVYEYYGSQPLEFYRFPFYWSFTNGAAIATIAVMMHFAWPLVKDKGWQRLAILPLGIIGTTMGEFGTGFPVFLAINANMATWLQWAVGVLTVPLAIVWIRVLAELVTQKDHAVDWTVWGLFRTRFLLPPQRDAYIQGRTRPAPAGGARVGSMQ
jgi:hypothetical protein